MTDKFRSRTEGPSIARETEVQTNAAKESADIAQVRSDVTTQINTAVGTSSTTSQTNLDNEVARAKAAESANASNISANTSRLNSSEVAQALTTASVGSAGTSTNVAHADHVHAVSIVSTEVLLSSASTVMSATDVPLGNLSITPAAGTYLARFTGGFTVTVNNTTMSVSLYSGASQKANSQVQVTAARSAMSAPASTQGTFILDGATAVSVKWSCSASGTATCNTGNLTLLRIK